jgi:hypothetical protein
MFVHHQINSNSPSLIHCDFICQLFPSPLFKPMVQPLRPSLLSTAVFKTGTAFYSWFHLQLSTTHIKTESVVNQQMVNVYWVVTMKLDSHQERGLNAAIERALKEVWPQVVEYMAQEAATGLIWAQIR